MKGKKKKKKTKWFEFVIQIVWASGFVFKEMPHMCVCFLKLDGYKLMKNLKVFFYSFFFEGNGTVLMNKWEEQSYSTNFMNLLGSWLMS